MNRWSPGGFLSLLAILGGLLLYMLHYSARQLSTACLARLHAEVEIHNVT